LLIGTLALIAAFALSGVAAAKIASYTGKFKTQPDSYMRIGLKFNAKGKPTEVSTLNYSNLSLLCSGGLAEGKQLPGQAGNLSEVPVKADGTAYKFKEDAHNGRVKITVTGRISSDGKKITGLVSHRDPTDGTVVCSVNGLAYSAKR
jgi:hypothetical protein